VKQIWSTRVAQAAAKYGEHAPVATACCNACRTCVTTNVAGLVAVGATALVARLVRWREPRSAARGAEKL
jgi:hypothetical protein